MSHRLSLNELIEKHQFLDVANDETRKYFISDWNGGHPFVEKFLGPELSKLPAKQGLLSQYIYFDEMHEALNAISRFHKRADGLDLTARHFLAGPGTSSILTALALWLLRSGFTTVFYLPPLYYTFHFFLRTLGLRLRPVSGKHAYEPDCVISLPQARGVLLLTDPVWYAGIRVPKHCIETIAAWQRQTNSLVIVDGAFQYMRWDGVRSESSAVLDPERTFRLISPAKALAIPAFRFAYLLHPKKFHTELHFLYENLIGSAGIADLLFGARALHVLSSKASNRKLTTFLRDTYNALVDQGIIETNIQPDCGYFTFALLKRKHENEITMGGDFFEVDGYPNYVRINLMKARQRYLTNRTIDRLG